MAPDLVSHDTVQWLREAIEQDKTRKKNGEERILADSGSATPTSSGPSTGFSSHLEEAEDKALDSNGALDALIQREDNMADTTARQKHHDLLHGTLDDAEYGNAAARQQYLDDAVDELTKNVGTEALRSVLQSKGSPDEQFRTLKIMEAYTQLMADKRDPRSLTDEEMDIVLRAHAEFDAAWQESPAPLRKFIYVDDAHAQLAGTPKRITTGGSVGDARNTADGMDLTQVSEVLGLDYSGSDYYVDGKVRADRQHFFFIDMPREYDDGSTVSSIGDARIPLHPMLIARAKDSTDPMVQALIEDDRLLEKDIYKDGQSKWEKTLDPSHPEYGKKSETNPYNALGGTAVSQPTEDLKKANNPGDDPYQTTNQELDASTRGKVYAEIPLGTKMRARLENGSTVEVATLVRYETGIKDDGTFYRKPVWDMEGGHGTGDGGSQAHVESLLNDAKRARGLLPDATPVGPIQSGSPDQVATQDSSTLADTAVDAEDEDRNAPNVGIATGNKSDALLPVGAMADITGEAKPSLGGTINDGISGLAFGPESGPL